MLNPIEELNSIAHLLPIEVLEDVNKRIGDWLASGGNDNDPYIHQQLRYAKRFKKDGDKNGTEKNSSSTAFKYR